MERSLPAQPVGEASNGEGNPIPLPAVFTCSVPTRSPQSCCHSSTAFPPTQWTGRCWITLWMGTCRPEPWLQCALTAFVRLLGAFAQWFDHWRSPEVRHPKPVGVRDRHSPASVGSLQRSLMQKEACALMSMGEREAFGNSLLVFPKS